MLSRAVFAVAVAIAAFATIPVEGQCPVAPAAAFADGEVRVGDRLVALTDVELDEAVIRAGSHVSVVGRRASAGGPAFDVALADGHVVRAVPLARLRAAFRVS